MLAHGVSREDYQGKERKVQTFSIPDNLLGLPRMKSHITTATTLWGSGKTSVNLFKYFPN